MIATSHVLGARHLAEVVLEALEPGCECVAVAGAERGGRRPEWPLELVCVPRDVYFFGPTQEPEPCRGPEFVAAVKALGFRGEVGARVLEWTLEAGFQVGGFLRSYVVGAAPVRLTVCASEDFGWGLFERSGPEPYVAAAKRQLRAQGYSVEGGTVRNFGGGAVVLRGERDVFRLLFRRWVAPEDRS